MVLYNFFYTNFIFIVTNVTALSWLWSHDDVIKWKHFPRYWPFVRGIHQSPVNYPHKCGALMFSLICARIKGWVNNREAGDLRRHRAHHDVTVMLLYLVTCNNSVDDQALYTVMRPLPKFVSSVFTFECFSPEHAWSLEASLPYYNFYIAKQRISFLAQNAWDPSY